MPRVFEQLLMKVIALVLLSLLLQLVGICNPDFPNVEDLQSYHRSGQLKVVRR
ncbi:MAG: hypothetical protein H7Z75_18020 [Ferruginibacter sp.]|nr:hypothetical protein [Cytophagales bacterium]